MTRGNETARLRADRQTAIRDSGIELLKIFAILLIIVSHVVETLGKAPAYYPEDAYVLPFQASDGGVRNLVLSLLQYSGTFGNLIFFVSSAWFLLRTHRNGKKKALRMATDNWFVSVLILLAFALLRRRLRGSLIFRSLFPLVFENQWYVNCYVLFLLLYPILNRFLDTLSKGELGRIALGAIGIYAVFPFCSAPVRHLLGGTSFFSSSVIQWVVIYITMAWLQRYGRAWLDDRCLQARCALLGLIGTYGAAVATYAVGWILPVFSEGSLMWSGMWNPFFLLMVLGLFNLFRTAGINSHLINYISSLSLYIYIVHENILVRNLLRPSLWDYIYTHFGYSHIFAWVFLQALVIFALSAIAAAAYRLVLHPAAAAAAEGMYRILTAWACAGEEKLRRLLDRTEGTS